MTSLADIKTAARKAAAEVRNTAQAQWAEQAPLALVAQPFPVTPEAGKSVVSGFYPYKDEIDTRPLLGKLAGEGWTTALPIVVGKAVPLEFRRWLPGEPTISGIWNIPRPAETAPLVEPDVLIVPLLSFDRRGYRLGYGGGFYDRTLEMLRARKRVVAIGVAFAAQEVGHVPHDGLDQRLDFVMTEQGVVACG